VRHDAKQGEVESTHNGIREFATVDLDGNLLIFFHRDAGPVP
jgi:hypothetical protein